MGCTNVSSLVRAGEKCLKRLLFIVSEDWYFVSHRLHLAETAIKQGYKVALLCQVEKHRKIIESAGIELIDWQIERGSLNPLIELRALRGVSIAINNFKPDLIHAVALKPVFYVAMKSKFCSVPAYVYALGGLGFVFSSKKFLARTLRLFLIMAFRWLLAGENVRLILQNPDDRELLIKSNTINENRIRLIRGAGVNTGIYIAKRLKKSGKPLVVLPARLLWNKGAGDFVAAAKILKNLNISARFALVGDSDLQNPECISQMQLDEWVTEGIIEVWGNRDDMPDVFNYAQIVCLPSSYGEGLPKALLEAASCAKPIITYDAPGCREIVINEKNGLLVPLNNVDELAKALHRLLLDLELCKKMGNVGRDMVIRNFSQEQVATETVCVWEEVLP